ncbi:MAG: hypothetical protein KGQ46_12520 [Hyphomicrobiales bacterium]|nr:hypothetical protein [Hyphomicrobiales bacterium]MDE2113815.1 hypothetical protein [Hyphomicrobiales bacterium]
MSDILPASPLVGGPSIAQLGEQVAAQLASPAPAPVAAPAGAAIAAPVAAAPAPAAIKLVDLDAGGGWGSSEYTFKHPFRFRNQEYLRCTIREPNGGDVERRIKGIDYMREVRELAVDLTMLPDDVFGVMHASDRSGILRAVGNAIADAP